MAFGKFLNLLGVGSAPQPVSDPFPPEPKPVAATVRAVPATPPPSAIMHREEIIDGRSRIAGYRFNARSPGGAASVDAETRLKLLLKEQIGHLASRRLAVIPLGSQEWSGHDFRQLINPGTVFQVVPPAGGISQEEWLSVLADIRGSGGKVALTGAAVAIPGALDQADMLVLNMADYDLDAFEQVVATIRQRHPSLNLMVENIVSWPEHRFCQTLGIPYSLGEFSVLADEEDTEEKLNQSRLVAIELLNLVRRDADAADLATVAKRDPAIALKVVSMANSPVSGLSSQVASVDQAIFMLGRAFLYRWLSISMFRVGGRPRDEALLEIALRRARFLEFLAQDRMQKHEADELFLVGLLSLLDILLGIPTHKIAERIHLPEKVVLVLVNSDGPYARHLMLAIALEKGSMEQTARLAALLDLDAPSIEEASAAARRWTEEALAAA